MNRTPLLAGFLALVAIAPAQLRPHAPLTPVSPKDVRTETVDEIAPLDRYGNQIGPWMPVKSLGDLQREAPVFKVAFDSMSTTTSTLQAWTSVYGPNAGIYKLPATYKIFMTANDMILPSSVLSRTAKFVQVGVQWNPNGSATASGVLTCIVKVYTGTNFNDDGNGPAFTTPLGGVALKRINLSGGQVNLQFNGGSIPGGVALPAGNGAVVTEIGTDDGQGNFTPLSGLQSASPLFGNMVSPGEPRYPGTNPSASTDIEWDDDTNPFFPGVNTPDHIFQTFRNSDYAELYGYNTEGNENKGILQAATTLFVDDNSITIGGKITFLDLAVAGTGNRWATVEIRDTASGTVLDTQTVAVKPDGTYQIVDPKPSTGGNYQLYISSRPWLRKRVAANSTGGVSLNNINATLMNGDIDGDNAVTVFDYSVLSDYFDRQNTDADWTTVGVDGFAPQDADLDRDGAVTVFDYSILSTNFDKNGD